MKENIIVGSRGSRLALVQSETVAVELRAVHPSLDVTIKKIVTEGDRNRSIPLEQVGSIGIFVKELEEALLDGRIDIAVHSLKDVPTEISPGLCLMASLERQDPRDVLISRGGNLDQLATGSRIGTDSLRRSAQLAHYRPDLQACSIRGNVDTRIRKVASGEFDGVMLAAAAMHRLGWNDKITQYLPLEHFLPAVGQAALVIEGRLNDSKVTEVVSPLNHLPTWKSVLAERAFLLTLGGGCRAPIGALGTVNGSTLRLEGMVADPTGKKVMRNIEEGDAAFPEELGNRLAEKMLAKGASEFIAEARKR
ncbi:MAG: hydroxymethylbilane synthase [Chloroflexi bacterium]|nr:hydroxymethylbilane synthase [Chloroflexota bacterium]